MGFYPPPVKLWIIQTKTGPAWPTMEFNEEDALTRAEIYAQDHHEASLQVVEITETKRLELMEDGTWRDITQAPPAESKSSAAS
jgi:hypothetical protein